MSSEINVAALGLYDPEAFGPLDLPGDRVLRTADDRPDDDTLPAMLDPAASHEIQAFDPDGRRADVEEKHRRVIAYLDRHGLDAVVLGRADSVAWFTAGGDLARELGCERASILLYVNRHSRAVLADNVQSARVFEEELAGLGFQLKERPWFEDPEQIVRELAHHKKVAADIYLPELRNDLPHLRRLRWALTRWERQLLRVLGRTVTLAVEATCRNFQPGETEADVAGHLAHRLLREGVVPVALSVAGDDRLARYRQPVFKSAPIRRHATISVVGRRHGLCAGVTRTVAFGPVDPGFQNAHNLAAMVDATCIFFSRPDQTVQDVFRRAKRIYEKFGHPDEWTLDYQGCLTGYSACETQLKPDSPEVLPAHTALRWSPSVESARSEDTVVIDGRGYEVVTEAQNWPRVEVTVKGFAMTRPGILERP